MPFVLLLFPHLGGGGNSTRSQGVNWGAGVLPRFRSEFLWVPHLFIVTARKWIYQVWKKRRSGKPRKDLAARASMSTSDELFSGFSGGAEPERVASLYLAALLREHPGYLMVADAKHRAILVIDRDGRKLMIGIQQCQ